MIRNRNAGFSETAGWKKVIWSLAVCGVLCIAMNGKAEEMETDAAVALASSEGMEFESNGDGTATLVSVGGCSDTDIVIPTVTNAGDTVTFIEEYAFYSLEDADSVTFVDYNYEIDDRAFQYGEMTSVRFIDCSVTIGKSAFSSCEDLTSVSFVDCELELDEYAFYGCGADMEVSFQGCSGEIGKRTFQYDEIVNLTITDSELTIEESAFSSCEDIVSMTWKDSILEISEYAFYGCGDSAVIDMENCSIVMDDRAFQYSSVGSLTISGDSLEMGKSAFSGCEDLETVVIDCNTVALDEYAFYGCEDLICVSVCDNENEENQIDLDDHVFQYSEKLESVIIGKGTVKMGEYCFSGCADELAISVSGVIYSADALSKGLPQ